MFIPQLNIVTKKFLLVSCSNSFQTLVLFMQGQGTLLAERFFLASPLACTLSLACLEFRVAGLFTNGNTPLAARVGSRPKMLTKTYLDQTEFLPIRHLSVDSSNFRQAQTLVPTWFLTLRTTFSINLHFNPITGCAPGVVALNRGAFAGALVTFIRAQTPGPIVAIIHTLASMCAL